MAGRLILPPSLPSPGYLSTILARRLKLNEYKWRAMNPYTELTGPIATLGRIVAGGVVNKALGATVNRVYNSVSRRIFGHQYATQFPSFRQVHLPTPMRRYGRRPRRRFRRLRRRRFGRKRFSRRSGRSSRMLTAQHDVRGIYRPSRSRGIRSFSRRVQAALVQLQPLGIYTYQWSRTTTGTANQDSMESVLVGGMTVSNNDELFQAMASCYAAIAGTIANAKPFEIYIRSLVVDVQLTNASAFPIMVDVYKLLCRRPYNSNVTPHSQLQTALTELNADATGGTITNTKPTLTPFDAPNFCEFWKVLSKQSTILQSGNFITMQSRMKRTKKVEGKLFATQPQAMPYYTQAYLFIVRGSPQNTAGGQLGAPTFVTSAQFNVHMCAPPGNQAEFGRTA